MSARPSLLSIALLLATLSLCLVPGRASAFCGFYVATDNASLTSEASSVVVLRDGQRTVLTMQPYYRGPIADFSMVVPVPKPIRRHQVETLEPELLTRLERLSSPRLVEYWERDPCEPPFNHVYGASAMDVQYSMVRSSGGRRQVHVEARFAVGEYEVMILGARDSLALEAWLRDEGYQLPEGAADALRPYVEQGMHFFVAKVDVDKVRFEDGRALLSPLRFHFDSEELAIPVRLGLLNAGAGGQQDLIVYVISRHGRFEAANRPNVAIPTNLEVVPETIGAFDSFYAALLDHSFRRSPEAVVTEYAWRPPASGAKCDPCTEVSGLTLDELASFGLDVVDLPREHPEHMSAESSITASAGSMVNAFPHRGEVYPRPKIWPKPYEFTVTRMRMRYGQADHHREDLVLRLAGPVGGGTDRGGDQPHASSPISGVDRFQGRYIVRHHWTGPIECEDPVRGRWGAASSRSARLDPVPAFLPGDGRELADFLDQPESELAFLPEPIEPRPRAMPEPATSSCRCATGTGTEPWWLGWFALAGLGWMARGRRRARPDA